MTGTNSVRPLYRYDARIVKCVGGLVEHNYDPKKRVQRVDSIILARGKLGNEDDREHADMLE